MILTCQGLAQLGLSMPCPCVLCPPLNPRTTSASEEMDGKIKCQCIRTRAQVGPLLLFSLLLCCRRVAEMLNSRKVYGPRELQIIRVHQRKRGNCVGLDYSPKKEAGVKDER